MAASAAGRLCGRTVRYILNNPLRAVQGRKTHAVAAFSNGFLVLQARTNRPPGSTVKQADELEGSILCMRTACGRQDLFAIAKLRQNTASGDFSFAAG